MICNIETRGPWTGSTAELPAYWRVLSDKPRFDWADTLPLPRRPQAQVVDKGYGRRISVLGVEHSPLCPRIVILLRVVEVFHHSGCQQLESSLAVTLK